MKIKIKQSKAIWLFMQKKTTKHSTLILPCVWHKCVNVVASKSLVMPFGGSGGSINDDNFSDCSIQDSVDIPAIVVVGSVWCSCWCWCFSYCCCCCCNEIVGDNVPHLMPVACFNCWSAECEPPRHGRQQRNMIDDFLSTTVHKFFRFRFLIIFFIYKIYSYSYYFYYSFDISLFNGFFCFLSFYFEKNELILCTHNFSLLCWRWSKNVRKEKKKIKEKNN